MANEISFEEFNAKYAPKQQDTEISFDDFNAKYAAEPKSRSFGDVASDVGSQLGKGVNTIAGAIPNLLDPSSPVSKFFNDNAQYWQNDQSQITKSLEAAADARIAEAAKTGQWEAFKTAVKAYGAEPALVQKLILENIPSMIPGLAAAKGAQIAAKGSVIAGTVAGAGTNSLLNAGGARQESYQDIKSTLIAQGVPEAEADAQALEKSKVAAGVGAATGALSGGSGLERGILGGAKGGFAKRAGVELGGEQLEEVAPTIATNMQLDRDMLTGVGETSAKTLIASSPGSVISGFQGNSQPVQPAPTGATQPDIASSSNVDELISATKSSIDVELDNQTNQDLLDEISASNNATSINAPVDQSYVPQPETVERPPIEIAPDVQPLVDNTEPLVSGQTQPVIEQSQPIDLNVNPVQASQEPQPTEGATNGTTSQYADSILDSGSAASTSANPAGSDGTGVLRYDATIGTGGLGLPGTVVETDGASGVSANGSNKPSDIGLGGKTQSLARDSSWVIRNKETGEVIMETFDKAKVDALNTAKYEAVPILQYMQGLNTPVDRVQPTVNSDFTPTTSSTLSSRSTTTPTSPPTPLPASAPQVGVQTGQPVTLPTENIEAQALNDRAVAVKNAIKGSYDILINQKSSVKSTAGYKKMLAAVEGVMGTGNGNAKQFKLYASGYKKSNPEVSSALKSIAKALEPAPTPKPLSFPIGMRFDASILGLDEQNYKSQNELSIAIAEAEHNLTVQGKEALEALLLEDQFDEIFGEKLTDTEIESWLSLLDNNEENDNSTTQGATESGVTKSTQSGEQDRDAEAQGGEGVDIAGKEPWQMTQTEYAASLGSEVTGEVREKHADAIKKAHAEGSVIPTSVLQSYPRLRDKFAPSANQESNEKPAAGKYTQPANVSDRKGQMELADRASRLVNLKLMNDEVGAYSDAEIQNVATDNIDAVQEYLRKEWNKAKQPTQEPKPQPESKPKNMAGEVRPDRPAPKPTPAFERIHPKSQEKFNAAWDAQDVSSLQEYLDPANKGLRAEFESRSGVKLPKTINGTDKTIADYFAKKEQPADPISQMAASVESLAKSVQALVENQDKLTENTPKFVRRGDFWNYSGNRVAEIAKVLDLTVTSRDGIKSVGIPNYARIDMERQLRDAGINAEFETDVYKKSENVYTSKERVKWIDIHADLFKRIQEGEVSADEFKASFDALLKNKDGITAELEAMTKPEIFKRFPDIEYRYKNEKKSDGIAAAYRDMITDFTLGQPYSYGMSSGSMIDSIRALVEKTTDESLADYADKRKKSREERELKREEAKAGMDNPQTLDDFNRLMSLKAQELGEGATFGQARMALTPEHREKFDELAAEKSRSERASRKAAQQEQSMRAPGEVLEATETIKTKHTKHGHDLWQFNLVQRVSSEEFKVLVGQAKRLGGDYSSYRGNGAIPGWQFRTEEAANAFKALIAGDTSQANEVAQSRRDAYADDRSQSATERLNEMADKLDEQADASLNQGRKENTHKRAEQAARAETAARSDKALAQTMRNIANAIADGSAKFLDQIRQKIQVEILRGFVNTGSNEMLRKRYPEYGDYLKHKDEPVTKEVADYITYPSYTVFRSDLANIGRALLEVDGTKKLGQQIMKVADDVSATYLKFAKDNIDKVATFRTKNGERAAFASKANAEEAITRSNYHGAAIVLPVKRGENLIILSPSEAIKRGIWEGDNDKRITLHPDIGVELVEKMGKAARRGVKISVPWQLENAYDMRKRLAGMNIETPAELRAAVREFIELREVPKEADKIKQLERAMIGSSNDGMDFFPTPANVADEMVQSADIREGMSVLEPSAGMGHIADRIRDAGVEPDVAELSGSRRELLEAKGYNIIDHDFMDVESKYDRIIMNPPFGDRRDAMHVQHAYSLLNPGGRVVAIVGDGVFFGKDAKAQEFRDWLEKVGGTDEKLDQGTFLDPSLPVNTGVSARMVVIDKSTDPLFSKSTLAPNTHTVASATSSMLEAHTGKIKSVLQAMLDTGKAKVVTAEQAAGIVGEDALYMTAWHGSPHDHDGFSMDKVGTGEGAQAFGHGLYFAGERAVAEYYQNILTKRDPIKLKGVEPKNEIEEMAVGRVNDRIKYGVVSAEKAIKEVILNARNLGGANDPSYVAREKAIASYLENLWDSKPIADRNKGKLYQVELAPDEDEYLLWDKPLSEQSEKVKAALQTVAAEVDKHRLGVRAEINAKFAAAGKQSPLKLEYAGATGEQLYNRLMARFKTPEPKPSWTSVSVDTDEKAWSGQKAASEYLHSLGIRGIKYLDGSSRSAGDGNFNYVIFNDQDVKITAKFAKDGQALAFYNPHDGITYFIADHIPEGYTAKEWEGLVLHEIATHALQLGKDSKEFKSILSQIEAMRKAGNKAIVAAFNRVPADTKPGHVVEETLAYAIQHSPQLGIVQRVLSWFRNAIRAIGKSFPTLQKMRLNVWANNLNESDLRFMAESALKNAERSGVQNESDTPQFSKSSQTDTPAFKKWFGGSKVVNADGTPMVVYHGGTTGENIKPFAGMIWLSENKDYASSFAEQDGGSIATLFASIKNPLDVSNLKGEKTLSSWRKFLSKNGIDISKVQLEDWAPEYGKYTFFDLLPHAGNNYFNNRNNGLIDQIKNAGFDGIKAPEETTDWIKSGRTYVVFDSANIKSATNNNGNFSKSDNNILFSKNTNPVTHPFQPENSGKPLDSWIKIFTRNQIVTLYRDSIIGKKLEEYKELRELVTADTNKLFEKADNFLLELRQIPKGLRDAFASLAHDSTLNNVDPSNHKYVPSPDAIKLADYLANNPTNQTLAAKIKKRLNSMEAAHKKLHAEFNALPTKEQELFKELRSKYTEQMTMVFDEFKNRIGRMKNIDPAIKASSVKKLDEQLADLLGRVYFPLYRAGNYIVKAEKAGEPTTVDHVESNFAADRLEKKLKKLGYTVSRSTRIVSPQDNKSGEALNAVRDLLDKAALKGKIEGAELSQLMDDIDQTILQSLPDQSYRKSFIHRKGTKGYSDDFIRAYADAMRRGSINIANLRHGDKITTVIEDMRKDVKDASKVPGSNVAALNQVVDRVEQIEVDIRSPTSKLVSVSGKIAFAQMLGSLSNFILNLTQTQLLTMPHLGAEYGYGKANLQLAMAYAKQMRSLKKQGTLIELGKWLDMRHGLVGNELDLMQQLHDSGALDLTQSFDLIDAANNPSYQENELSMNFMKVIALPQHVSEIVNRQVTALATIRLEMARSGSPLKAYHAARKAIDQTHFDYSKENRAKLMTGNTQSILFRFKQYAQQAAFLFVHTAKLALDGSTKLDSDGNKLDGTRPSERTKARKQLAGVLGMQILMAGTLGLPVFAEAAVAASGVAGFKLAGSTGAYIGVAGAIIVAAALAFGDDDGEEFDVEVKKWFIKHFGEGIGSSLADGIIPRGLASRLNASELVIRRPEEARNSTDFANQWMISLLGAFWGGTVYNAGVGLKDIVEGDTAKGATKLIPVKAIKDLVTSWKWANDGMNVTNKDGEIITPVSKADIFFKSIGINPTSVVNAREYDNAKFTLHNALLKKQQKALKELREETDKTKRFNAIIKYNKSAPLGYEIDSDKVRGVIAREIKYKGKPNVVTGNPVQEDYLNKNTKELRPAY